MSIILPRGLPAVDRLRQNGIEVVSPGDARGQGRRALRVVLVNLMPTKVQTEQQIARLLGGAGPHVELTLALPDGYRPRTAPAGHVKRFYRRFGEIRGHRFDAIIVTGAPVENLPFCWAAQAALKHFHGVEKRSLAAKRFGVFRHRVRQPRSPLFRGFEETFDIPVSRHTEVHRRDLEPGRGLVVLADSPQAGPCLVEDAERRALYMFNHWEYEADTLAAEYERDRAAGKKIAPPVGYPAGGERPRPPVNNWSEPARLFFRNWLALARADAGCMSARAAA
jgi:homoserine O-succinyltransferase